MVGKIIIVVVLANIIFLGAKAVEVALNSLHDDGF